MRNKSPHQALKVQLLFIALSIVFSLTFFSLPVFSQSIRGAEFSDGSVIIGEVLQLNAETITIRTADGKVHVRKFADVTRFIKDDKEVKVKSSESGEAPTTGTVAVKPRRGYFTLGGGSGGDANCSNGRLEGGAYTTDQQLNYLLGLGFTMTFNRDQTPNGLLDYPVPHSSYRILGERNKGEEYGFYAKFGIEPINGSGLFLFGLGGFTAGQTIMLAQSTVTGWYYTQWTNTTTYGLYGGGIGYFGTTYPISVQVSYDNRMGTTGMIGITW